VRSPGDTDLDRFTGLDDERVLNNFWRGCNVPLVARPASPATPRLLTPTIRRHHQQALRPLEEHMAEISRLPGPVMDLWEWQFDGACRDADQDLFFHPEGERGSARRRRAEAAKAICATCPVLKECREQSLQVREPYGVWGGLSEDERAAILSQRTRTTKAV